MRLIDGARSIGCIATGACLQLSCGNADSMPQDRASGERGSLSSIQQAATVSEAGAKTVDDHFVALRAAMNGPTSMESKYDDCVNASATPQDCRSVLSDLLFAVLSQYVEPYIMANKEALGALASSDTYAPTLMQHYTEVGADDRSRIAALALLDFVPESEPGAFSAATFSDLKAKSDPELQLLLELHATHAHPVSLPTDDSREAVLQLAMDAALNGGIRDRATRALADPANVPYIQRLAASEIKTLDGAGSPLLSRALPLALGVCGRGCESLLLELYSSTGDRRNLALRSFGWLRDRQLVDEIVATEGKTRAGMDNEIEAAMKPILITGGVPDPRQAWQTK